MSITGYIVIPFIAGFLVGHWFGNRYVVNSHWGNAAAPFGTTNALSVTVSDSFPCLAGDTLTFAVYQSNGSSIALGNNAAQNSISIERVGN